MITINNIDELVTHMGLLPVAAKLDINKRIIDWLQGEGTSYGDLYCIQQFRYAESLINRI